MKHQSTMWLLIVAAILAIYLLQKIIGSSNYWAEKGVTQLKPWPFFGNMAPVVFRTRSLTDLSRDFYKAFEDKRYIGIYQFLQPTLLIFDIELIKQITVKEFETFPDHNIFATSDADPVSSKNLFNLTVAKGWHDMRATLSPSFTSSKMRAMFNLMEECATQLIQYLEKQRGAITLEMKDVFTRYTNDVIGTTAFGVTCNSLEDQKNEFYLMGKDLTDFNGLKSLTLFGYSISPKLMKMFNISMFSKPVVDFFRTLIKQSVKVREENKIVRPDMIHLMMEARRGRLKYDNQNNVVDSGFAVAQESEIGKTQRKKVEITDDDITAQALIFFLAGFDTASTVMSYAAYELALNPEVQRKLQEEIEAAVKESNGNITYEALLGMKYLDYVISETLRKWPPGAIIDRKSVRPFTIQPERPGEKSLYMEAGSVLWIPVFAIHRDPKHYPDPDTFNPERFSDENKQNIKPFTYMPFGSGPRNCIGSRFALLESKLILLKILQKFTIEPTEKTQVPIQLSKKTFNIIPEGGFWLRLTPREVP